MAYENNPNENPITQLAKTAKLEKPVVLSRYFRTVANEKFVSSYFRSINVRGTVEKINGYIGRRDAKVFDLRIVI